MKIKQLILITLSVIVGSIIIYSCTKDANEDAKSQYSGEEMFRAIYFLEGNAVNELSSLKPALSQMQKSKSANPDRKRDEFVKEMNMESRQVFIKPPTYRTALAVNSRKWYMTVQYTVCLVK